MSNSEEKKWILSLDKEEKIYLMHEILKSKNYGVWFRFVDVLLEAPISAGGITTDEIDSIWSKYIPKPKKD